MFAFQNFKLAFVAERNLPSFRSPGFPLDEYTQYTVFSFRMLYVRIYIYIYMWVCVCGYIHARLFNNPSGLTKDILSP